MSSFTKYLAVRQTISEIAQHRDNAIKHLMNMKQCMDLFHEDCKQIGKYVGNTNHMALDVDKVIKDVDRMAWRTAFSLTGIAAYMDAKARAEFENGLEIDPPEFTHENIKINLLSAMQESEMMFKRGIVELFKRLSGSFKCHDTFKINKKLICSHWLVTCRTVNRTEVNYRYEDEITDFERALIILDGKPYTKPMLSYKIQQNLHNGNLTYEDDYMILKAYKNGNAHIQIKRMDLVDRINEVIAEWYGSKSIATR